jgi:hypothetical protein
VRPVLFVNWFGLYHPFQLQRTMECNKLFSLFSALSVVEEMVPVDFLSFVHVPLQEAGKNVDFEC